MEDLFQILGYLEGYAASLEKKVKSLQAKKTGPARAAAKKAAPKKKAAAKKAPAKKKKAKR